MSHTINGMQYSYDYQELIDELKADIEEGQCKPNEIIYIVRGEHPDCAKIGYKPITDYYLNSWIKKMQEPLVDNHEWEGYSDEEWAEIEEEHNGLLQQYEQDKEHFESATATAVLTEMESWNSII